MKKYWVDFKQIRFSYYGVLFIALLLFLICVFVVYYSYNILYELKWRPNNIFSHPAASGSLGDIVNGITAPILMVCMAGLTFLAFWVQFQANEIQRKYLKDEIDRNQKLKEIDLINKYLDPAIERINQVGYDVVDLENKKILKLSLADSIKRVRSELAMVISMEKSTYQEEFIESLGNALRLNFHIISKIDKSSIDREDKEFILSFIFLNYQNFFGDFLLYLMLDLNDKMRNSTITTATTLIKLDHYLGSFYKPTLLIFDKYLKNLNETNRKLITDVK